MRLLHASENFPVFYHSTSFILSACGCFMGKGSYRNTKHKYVIRGFEADVWFSLWFLSVCFVFYGSLSKNDHAVPTCWPDQTKPQNPVLFHMELCCGPSYLLEQWMGLPAFSHHRINTAWPPRLFKLPVIIASNFTCSKVILSGNFYHNESLTNDVVSFEQLGPGRWQSVILYCLNFVSFQNMSL